MHLQRDINVDVDVDGVVVVVVVVECGYIKPVNEHSLFIDLNHIVCVLRHPRNICGLKYWDGPAIFAPRTYATACTDLSSG